MTLQIPTLLALLGAALLTIAIFAPKRPPVYSPLAYAPATAPHVERCASQPPSFDAQEDGFAVDDPLAADDAGGATLAVANREHVPHWPLLVDSRATACDAVARAELAGALIELDSPWAGAIVRRALDEERDERVCALLASGRYRAGTS